MPTTTISSREFNQDRGRARKALTEGPVIVTDRGKPSFVLLSFDEYERMRRSPRNLADALSMTGLSDIDLDAELVRSKESPRPFEFD